MPFYETSRPPAAELPNFPVSGDAAWSAPIPPLGLFKNEIRFWTDRRNQADQGGEPAARRFAEEALGGLCRAARWRGTAELLVRKQVEDNGAIREWLESCLLVVSHSRMMRELDVEMSKNNTESQAMQFAFKPGSAFAVDFSEYEPQKSGLHVQSNSMEYWLQTAPPEAGQTRYYEGQALYLFGSAPASPTDSFTHEFQEFYGQPFQPDDYVTLLPRIKADFWRTGTVA